MDGEHALPVGVADLQQRGKGTDAGDVDGDLHRAEGCADALDRSAYRGGIADVTLDGDTASTGAR